MGSCAWVTARKNGSRGDKAHDLPALIKSLLKGRCLVREGGYMMRDEQDVGDALELARIVQRLNERCRIETARHAQERSRAELERMEPHRRAEAERRARAEAEEMIAREAELEKRLRIERRARELAGTAAPVADQEGSN